jgi:hypothetical protein
MKIDREFVGEVVPFGRSSFFRDLESNNNLPFEDAIKVMNPTKGALSEFIDK